MALRVGERGKNPGAAREEGRKERREDATLIPFLIERQQESSRAQLREEAANGDLDRPTRGARDDEVRKTREMAQGPCITLDLEEEGWRAKFEKDLMRDLMRDALRPVGKP